MSTKSEKKEELLTAGKIAEKLGVPVKLVSQTIKQLNIQPDQKKGACSYYTLQTMEKIKKAISG